MPRLPIVIGVLLAAASAGKPAPSAGYTAKVAVGGPTRLVWTWPSKRSSFGDPLSPIPPKSDLAREGKKRIAELELLVKE